MLVKNINKSIGISLTALQVVGFWPSEHLKRNQLFLYNCYGVICFMFLLGSYILSQSIEMYRILGDIPLMTSVAFVMLTNVAQAIKIVSIVGRRRRILNIIRENDQVLTTGDDEEAIDIIKRCDRETKFQQIFYCILTSVTLLGWATSAEAGQLPLRGWYPYDYTKSPAYELSYAFQVGALGIAAMLNIAKDTLVTALIAQCRCRLKLLGLSLRSLGRGLEVTNKQLLSPSHEALVKSRLKACVEQHTAALETTLELEACFSLPIFVQFNVSLLIICVTAFQMVSMTGNPVRLTSMGTYLFNMMFQVFLYCYQGNQLSEESTEIAGAAYECPWYAMSIPIKKSLLIVAVRSRRTVKITAGGFTTLSLGSFMAIIKMSYSMFTLLQQLEL